MQANWANWWCYPIKDWTEKYLAMISRFSNQSFGDFESRARSFFEKLRWFHIQHVSTTFLRTFLMSSRLEGLLSCNTFRSLTMHWPSKTLHPLLYRVCTYHFNLTSKEIVIYSFIYLFPHVSIRDGSILYTNHLVGLKRWRASSPALALLTDTDLFCIVQIYKTTAIHCVSVV